MITENKRLYMVEYRRTHKEQAKRTHRIYLENHKEEVKAKKKISDHNHYMKTKDKQLKRNRAWAKAHPEKMREYKAAWVKRNYEAVCKTQAEAFKKAYAANPEKFKAKAKAEYDKDPQAHIERSNEWKKKNPGKVKATQRKRTLRLHGITEEEFTRLLGKYSTCPGCTRGFGPSCSACIDHNHTTGKVRGLLCHKCNMALGYVYDNPTTLLNLNKYIRDTDG